MLEIKIGQVLKRLLKEKRTNLKEVSRETGIPYSTLYTWQENRTPKDILKAQLLASHLGITLHELLFDQKDRRDEPKKPEPLEEGASDFFKGRFEVNVVMRRIE
jgi:DNA phosphorothioation-dependent restriction protein DptG